MDKESRTKVMTLIMRQLNDLKRGKFRVRASIDKEMLVNTTLLAGIAKYMIEERREYRKQSTRNKVLSLEEWLDLSIRLVERSIIEVAKRTINLQSVYFMEGK